MAVNVKRNPKNVSRPPSKKCFLMAVNFNEVVAGLQEKLAIKRVRLAFYFGFSFSFSAPINSDRRKSRK